MRVSQTLSLPFYIDSGRIASDTPLSHFGARMRGDPWPKVNLDLRRSASKLGPMQYDLSKVPRALLFLLASFWAVAAQAAASGATTPARSAVAAPTLSSSDFHRLVAWTVATMRHEEPAAPWRDTFESSAAAMVLAAEASPLYDDDHGGIRRTVADLVSLGTFEGALRTDAEGDCVEKVLVPVTARETSQLSPSGSGLFVVDYTKKTTNKPAAPILVAKTRTVPSVSGRCPAGSKPQSFCMFQINASNFRAYDVTREQMQTDFPTCVRVGLAMMRVSHAVCQKRPLDDKLAHYAHGGGTCAGDKGEGLMESRHRMGKAKTIYASFPELSAVVLSEDQFP